MSELLEFDRASERVARTIMSHYSTSFTLATSLLPRRVRRDITDIYAMVRIADELVDGLGPAAGLALTETAARLEAMREDVLGILNARHDRDCVVHAFGLAARRLGIGAELIDPFFASMRMDLSPEAHDRDSLNAYVYGSAEVIGLMCLRAFTHGHPEPSPEVAAARDAGARRLGAAFQKINFLRDFGSDTDRLGRNYLPALEGDDVLDERSREYWLRECEADLAAGRDAIALLPRDCRLAVLTAHDVFAALAARIRRTPVNRWRSGRVRVPNAVKITIASRALLRVGHPQS